MSQAQNAAAQAALPEVLPEVVDDARRATAAAQEHLLRVLRRDHWRAELESNATITAEYVMLQQMLGLPRSPERAEGMVRYLSSRQTPTGPDAFNRGSRTLGERP